MKNLIITALLFSCIVWGLLCYAPYVNAVKASQTLARATLITTPTITPFPVKPRSEWYFYIYVVSVYK